MTKRSAPMLIILAALGFGACESQPIEAGNDGGAMHDGATPASDAPSAPATDAPPAQTYPTREAYCEGEGPPIVLTPQGGTACTGLIAQVAFRYAICSCEAFDGVGDISTDGFDHTQSGYDPTNPGSGAAVGVNAELTSVGAVLVGGPLSIGGALGLDLVAQASVRGTLGCGGPVTHQDDLTIAKDAFVAGDFRGAGTLTIDGTLTQPAGNDVYSLDSDIHAREEAPVNIPAPCDCSEEKIYDIAGLVHAQRAQNDNAAIALDPSSLVGMVTGEKRVKLPCGRFYLHGIQGVASLVLEIEGRVALFVAGTLEITGGLRVELAPGAELDLFIEEGLKITGDLNLGDKQAPARTRVYVGGAERIQLIGGSALNGNLYAPRAELASTGELEVFGALFARRLSVVGDLSVHYDRAILDVGAKCTTETAGSPPPECNDCRDCGNQACVDGHCGACSVDADCCAPLLCREGRCVAPIL
ncbi:MAG: hypothetical protein JRH20_19635 [Deltaproteobacteria bacterium]|nr:hypothetical protein [Deltaproteobacteria bacterium]